MAVVDELVTILGVKLGPGAMNKLGDFKKSIASVAKGVTMLGAAVTGAAAVAGMFIKGQVEQAAQLQKLADTTGMSTTALQEWSYAAGQAGADAGRVQKDLGALNKKFMDAGKGAEESLLRMADSFSRMTEDAAQAEGRRLGLSHDTILLLKKGRDGVEELRQEAHKLGGIIPEKSIKLAAEFKKKLEALKFTLKGMASQLALATIPTFDSLVERFKKWLDANKEWIKLKLNDVISGINAGLEDFGDIIDRAKKKLKEWTEKIEEFLPEGMTLEYVVKELLTSALLLLGVALVALAVKFGMVTAPAVILALVLKDLFDFLRGKPSVIGDMAKALDEFGQELEKFGAFLGEVFAEEGLEPFKQAFFESWEAIKNWGADAIEFLIEKWNGFKAWMKQLWADIKADFPDLEGMLPEFMQSDEYKARQKQAPAKLLKDEDFDKQMAALEARRVPAAAKVPNIEEIAKQFEAAARVPAAAGQAGARGAGAQAAGTQQVNSNNDVDITIHQQIIAPDPVSAANQAASQTHNVIAPYRAFAQ